MENPQLSYIKSRIYGNRNSEYSEKTEFFEDKTQSLNQNIRQMRMKNSINEKNYTINEKRR